MKTPPIPPTGWRHPPQWETIIGGDGASRPRAYSGPFATYEEAQAAGRRLVAVTPWADWYLIREKAS